MFVGEPSSVFKKANFVSMSKATSENDNSYHSCNSRKSELWNGKSELCPEHHTLFKPSLSNCQKKAKKSIVEIFVLGQIVEAANAPEDISTYVLKENKVKMIRPKV